MALNNLERYAAVVDRGVFFQTLAVHPGAAHLLARLGGSSQFLADVLRRRPSHLATSRGCSSPARCGSGSPTTWPPTSPRRWRRSRRARPA